jgi:hypothetical protein
MAKKQELEITIGDDGKIAIKVIGAQGKECLEMTKALEEALGLVVDRQKTSDFYVEAPKTQVDQKGGQS